MTTLFDFETDRIHRSAEISECGRYRWWLHRSWRLFDREGLPLPGKGTCCFVMLNPSTADAMKDDSTIRRCIGFARGWGFTTLSVRNLFPWRATDPRDLHLAGHVAAAGKPRGNSELLAGCTADLLVAAWGAGVPYSRDREALNLFAASFPDKAIFCLGITKHGHPRHPLYVKGDVQPVIFTGAA